MTSGPGFLSASSRRPLLIASLIVRDESDQLADCLAALTPLVDHIHVCDTGSTDDTAAIATRAGATVSHFEWTDDFGVARNHALAAADAEWVLSIDADERLICPDPQKTRLALSNSSTTALSIELVNDRGPDFSESRAWMVRLFRPDQHRFEGALHERLVGLDGGPPSADRTDWLSIVHHGYDPSRPSFAENRARNLAIAEKQHAQDPTPRATLDLARALAETGAGAEQVLALVEPPLAGSEANGMRPDLLALAVDFSAQAADWDAAHEYADELLDLDPGSDVAAAVLARSATERGDAESVMELIARFDPSHPGPTRVPANRAIVDAYAANSLARQGDIEEALARASSVPQPLPSVEEGVRILLDACRGLDQSVLTRLVTSAAGDETAAVLATILEDSRDAPPHAEPVASPSTVEAEAVGLGGGITLDLDGLAPRINADQVMALLPPDRRLLDLTASPTLAPAAQTAGHTVTAAGIDECSELASSQRFDIIVSTPEEWTAHAPDLRALLDPAGVAVVWFEDGGATAADVDGYMTAIADDGIVLARPIWDETVLAPPPPVETTHHLVTVLPEEASEETLVALRASLPATVSIEVVTDASDVPADDGERMILALPVHVLPEPAWVQELWDTARRTKEPVGARLIDQHGRIVQAGAVEGRAVGIGEDARSPLFLSDRFDTELLAPFVAPSGALSDDSAPVRGRLRGDVVAVTLGSPDASDDPPRLAEILRPSVLFLGGPAPGQAHPDEQDELDRAFAQLLGRGVTPVYQPAPHGTVDHAAEAAWRRTGVVVIPPPPKAIAHGLLRPDAIRPQPAALQRSLTPEAVVYMTADALGTDFRAIRGEAAQAAIVYAGLHSVDEVADRVDFVCDPASMAEHVDEWLAFRADPVPTSVPTIEPVESLPGTTSIIIPVWNRWDLTRACLDSIRRHTPMPVEIVVVDNGSTDATPEALTRADVTVITNAENLGFPKAVNQGIAAARGEFICVLNNDTQVTHGWLEALHEALALPGTGLVGPRTNQIGGLQQVPDAPGPEQGKAAHRWAKDFVRERNGRTWTIDRLVGFCLLGRRSLFEELGGFDEGFGIGNFEDDELGLRVQDAGLSLRVVDDSFVLHHGSATFTSMGVDYEAALHRAARHLSERPRPPAPVSVIVLSGGDSRAAAISAGSAMLVSDDVRVIERTAVASSELATKVLAGGGIEVVSLDWMSDEGARRALGSSTGRTVIVLEAGERIEVDDWGAARAELEQLPSGPVEVGIGQRSEVRIVPAVEEHVVDVGGSADESAHHLRIVPPG